MNSKLVQSFAFGVASSLALGSPAEAYVHRKILHAKPNERVYEAHGRGLTRFFTGIKAKIVEYIDTATYGHQDCHHAAYRLKEHYYRDVTNEAEVIHFAPIDVGIIFSVASFLGTALTVGYSSVKGIMTEKFDLGPEDASYAVGFATGAMVYYAGYEIFHHNMHVIGKRRLEINRVLGDNIQGGIANRDSKLRLSKPLLDDICNGIEIQIDEKMAGDRRPWSFEYQLEDRLDQQLRMQANDVSLASPMPNAYQILSATATILLERERVKPTGYWQRNFQRQLRNSPFFEMIDNHHFVHHVRYLTNLNVLFPLADHIAGTKIDSSRKTLENDKLYWLCPNSPDEKPFVRPERKRKK